MFNQLYGSISRHITPLVINSLGGRHTHTQTHIQTSAQEQFQETRRVPACGRRAPGLKTETKHCLLAFHMASIRYLMASNEYCLVAHYTFTLWLPSNDSWSIWLVLLIRYIRHVKMQLNDMPLKVLVGIGHL